MNVEIIKERMNAYRDAVDKEAKVTKNSFLPASKLRAFYEKLDEAEQRIADQVLSEWALSEDENLRFDALALIYDLQIITTLPALHKLASRLASSNAPGAPYEIRKIMRTIKHIQRS